MIHRTSSPRTHGAWTHPWFDGDAALSKLFGPAPTLPALAERATSIRVDHDWTAWVRPPTGTPAAPRDALLVLAGQQPVLAGGPALVIHKAISAIALARALAPLVDRPVLPVFLLATQDHDHTEIDHLDLLDASGRIQRLRCPVQPPKEMFARAHWDRAGLARAAGRLGEISPNARLALEEALKIAADPVASHVEALLDRVLGPLGLHFVEAHALAEAGAPVLERALGQHAEHQQVLREGEGALRAVQLKPAFDPEDPRPLVLESRDDRRQRLEASTLGAFERLAARPEDFSPHAGLRPIVQAACLPVVAQVAGPSEIVYLGQARRLHELHGVTAPLLVPRLEATRLSAAEHELLAPDYLLSPGEGAGEAEAEQLFAASEALLARLTQLDPESLPQARRWDQRLRRDVARLQARPYWRGRKLGSLVERLRPRGRAQDATLSWLPDAFQTNDPRPWAEHLLGLATPYEAPVHIFHTPLGDGSDG